MREVTSQSEGTAYEIEVASVRAVVCRLDEWPARRVGAGGIDVLFAGETLCSRLHEAFFGDPEVTDVMTFPGTAEDGQAGDITVCPEFAARAAVEYGTGLAEELTLYLVHAWLHLSGMEDATEKGREAMREAEKAALVWLGDTRLKVIP